MLSSLSPNLRLQVYELTVQPITDRALMPERMRRNVEIREIRPGDPELQRMPVRPEIMRTRLAHGCLCLGAFRKGEMIGYMWFRFRDYEEDEVRCTYHLKPVESSVFDFDFYLFPEHRMGVGFVALWDGANRFLRERGIRYTFSRITRFNLASRRAHAHLGARVIGKAMFLKLGALEITATTVRPYFAVTVRSRVNLDMTPRGLDEASAAASAPSAPVDGTTRP